MRQQARLRMVMASLLILASAIPNLGNELNILGSFLNFYRLMVVFLALITLIVFRGELRITERRSFLLWMGFLSCWLFYGVLLLLLSPYAEAERGTRELFSILCGLLSFYILSNLKLSEREIESVFRVMFWVLAAMLVLGAWEIITGNHLSSSMFNDPANEVAWRVDTHSATGFLYNVNDYSALITLMLPVVVGRYRIVFRRGYLDPGWFLIIATAVINRVNDANFCNAALVVGVFTYILLHMGGDRRRKGWVLVAATVLLTGLLVMYFLNDGDSENVVSRTMDLVSRSAEGTGSLHSRLLIYRDALSAGWLSGFLGMGPGGFSLYYTENPSDSGFINPHSLLLEIFSEYGLIIVLLFIVLLVLLFRNMHRIFLVSKDPTRRVWGQTGMIWIVTYLIVSFASSNYLPNSFHWTLLALICLMKETIREEEPEIFAREFEKKESYANEGLSYNQRASAGGYPDIP